VDLDVDEESPFLRGQKRVSARRSSLPQKTANRLIWISLAAAVVGFATVAASAFYRYGERSWRFRVDSSDNIEITGTQNVTKGQIMEVMGADMGRNVFFIPLAQQKAQLEQIPWVESASVMRFVPNRLKVEIHERTPVAFARVGPRISLIDASGALMELTSTKKYSFPVILGMNAGEPLSTRAPRMKVYNELARELDSGGAHYSQDLSESASE
jgi:cell division protein FtsQ